MVACLLGYCMFDVVKRRREKRLREILFKRNGGMLLEQQISSDEDSLQNAKIYTIQELQNATDNFNVSRVIGQGGQGTVYKGMLMDGKIVAVKKSKTIEASFVHQFINEVVILSQINHRNVVKLLGCCLEAEVPLLVYEYITNGTLYELIHSENEGVPLSWEMRVHIAVDIAGALAYLHSATSVPIYHKDVKSSNVLLDDKYRAKVADFGTSRSVHINQTHLTTIVQGTFGYLDPEFCRSSQFTEKSDVYSFGVVLLELLTGQKPVMPPATSALEHKNLAAVFLLLLEDDRLSEIVDIRVTREGTKEEIAATADLAKRCLNMVGKLRPTMTEVVMELEGVRMSHLARKGL